MSSDAKILLACIKNTYEKRIESGQSKESAIAFQDTDVRTGEIANWSVDRFRDAKKELADNGVIKLYLNNFRYNE